MKKVALITNYNISEKLSAAMRVADRIAPRVESILLPVAYKERVMRSKNHRKEFEYRTPEEIYSLSEVIFVLGGDGAMLIDENGGKHKAGVLKEKVINNNFFGNAMLL